MSDGQRGTAAVGIEPFTSQGGEPPVVVIGAGPVGLLAAPLPLVTVGGGDVDGC
ncbi:hypothetical protein [Streptosporangium sp. LJ11]|uniref:hypothetical protein n=1 Tax=Streptosporangium sp. LJ11 TaxID=3436927 RepID=UPI003F7A1430